LLWAGLSAAAMALGALGFFFFDLVALKDPDSRTVSELLREFNTWGYESYLLTIGLPALFFTWYVWHLLNLRSP